MHNILSFHFQSSYLHTEHTTKSKSLHRRTLPPHLIKVTVFSVSWDNGKLHLVTDLFFSYYERACQYGYIYTQIHSSNHPDINHHAWLGVKHPLPIHSSEHVQQRRVMSHALWLAKCSIWLAKRSIWLAKCSIWLAKDSIDNWIDWNRVCSESFTHLGYLHGYKR